MREFDAPAKILSEDMEVHGEILAHPPRSPNLLMRALIQKAGPFKPQLRPWDWPPHNWRKNAREDFYFKAAILLATMIFNGKDGHRPLTDAKAVSMWHDLQTGKKQRGEDTLLRIWKRRDSGFKQNAWTPPGKRWAAPGKRWADAPYLTRADHIKMIATSILEADQRFLPRVQGDNQGAKIIPEMPFGISDKRGNLARTVNHSERGPDHECGISARPLLPTK